MLCPFEMCINNIFKGENEMKIGLENIISKDVTWSNEYLDARIAQNELMLNDMDQMDAAYENLCELRSYLKNGHADVVEMIAGRSVDKAELDTAIASLEDFWSGAGKVAMATADVVTLGYAGSIKTLIESILETTQQLSKKYHRNLRRLKGRKITDADVVDTRAATLVPFQAWVFRAQTVFQIHQEFAKINAKNAFAQMKKISELCAKIGYRPRGLNKLFGIQAQTFGKYLVKERWQVSNDKAGKLGWNAANLNKAIPICEKLLNVRFGDVYMGAQRIMDPKNQNAMNELNKAGMTFKQMNKAVTAITMATYHEIGKLVRGVNKLLQKIDNDYEDTED